MTDEKNSPTTEAERIASILPQATTKAGRDLSQTMKAWFIDVLDEFDEEAWRVWDGEILAIEQQARDEGRQEAVREARELLDSVDDGPDPRARFGRILDIVARHGRSSDPTEEADDAT